MDARWGANFTYNKPQKPVEKMWWCIIKIKKRYEE